MKLRKQSGLFWIINMGDCETHRDMNAEASSYDAVGVLDPL